MCQHAMMIGGEIGQQFVFDPCQLDLFLAALHNVPDKIDGDRPGLYNLVVVLFSIVCMAQGHAHTRQELLDPKGLGEVIVRTHVEGGNLVTLTVANGKDDDRSLCPFP